MYNQCKASSVSSSNDKEQYHQYLISEQAVARHDQTSHYSSDILLFLCFYSTTNYLIALKGSFKSLVSFWKSFQLWSEQLIVGITFF